MLKYPQISKSFMPKYPRISKSLAFRTKNKYFPQGLVEMVEQVEMVETQIITEGILCLINVKDLNFLS